MTPPKIVGGVLNTLRPHPEASWREIGGIAIRRGLATADPVRNSGGVLAGAALAS